MEIYERSQEVCQLIKEESREGEPQQQTKKPASRSPTRTGLKYAGLPSMGIVQIAKLTVCVNLRGQRTGERGPMQFRLPIRKTGSIRSQLTNN
jgi:hypothetical protein